MSDWIYALFIAAGVLALLLTGHPVPAVLILVAAVAAEVIRPRRAEVVADESDPEV